MSAVPFSTDSLPSVPAFSSEELLKKFIGHVSKSSWKFANINFKKGLEELKKRAAGQISQKIDVEKLFVDLFSNNVDIIYKDVVKLDFKLPENGAVFYSGDKAKKVAWLYAYKIGSKVIEQTGGGSLFEYWKWFNDIGFKVKYWGKPDKSNDQAVVWAALSKAYAKNAIGEANVFQEKVGKIWKGYEKPMLDSKGIKYVVHKIGPSTDVKSLVNDLLAKRLTNKKARIPEAKSKVFKTL